jgi:DNA-binding HxlR family transcriptional regulator
MSPISKHDRKIDWLQDECPIKATIDVIGGRWKPLILYYLLERPKRFSELQKHAQGVTPQMLTLQLRQLEADGIIDRKIYPEVPVRVEYDLTPYGRTLSVILLNMEKWGEQHLNRRDSSKNGHRPHSSSVKKRRISSHSKS